jgi:hypothetical protein
MVAMASFSDYCEDWFKVNFFTTSFAYMSIFGRIQ